MKRIHLFAIRTILLSVLAVIAPALYAQESSANSNAAKVASVEISPVKTDAEVGQKMTFTVLAKDKDGKQLNVKPSLWVALPVDSAVADENGTVTFFEPGEIKVVAIVGGKPAFGKVTVKPARVSKIDIDPIAAQVSVGGTLKLNATPRVSNSTPRNDVAVAWMSKTPRIATVDAAGFVTGIAPGKATLRASAEGMNRTVTVQVVANPVRALSVVPSSTNVRTGDVIHFAARARNIRGGAVQNPSVRWAVSGEGAMIEPDGGFVAERPGSYVVTGDWRYFQETPWKASSQSVQALTL